MATIRLNMLYSDIFFFFIDKIRSHGIIGVIDRNIPSLHAVAQFFMEIDAQIQPVADRKAVIVSMGNVINQVTRCRPCTLFSNRSRSARIKNPSDPYIRFLAESMVYTEVDVVAAIVFIRKTFAVVDRPVLELGDHSWRSYTPTILSFYRSSSGLKSPSRKSGHVPSPPSPAIRRMIRKR